MRTASVELVRLDYKVHLLGYKKVSLLSCHKKIYLTTGPPPNDLGRDMAQRSLNFLRFAEKQQGSPQIPHPSDNPYDRNIVNRTQQVRKWEQLQRLRTT
jgi:hypothetical protein